MGQAPAVTTLRPDLVALLARHFPDAADRYYAPMVIGDTPASADAGAALILDGIKTATSSAPWHYPQGGEPFEGALSVLLDGTGQARAIVETRHIARLAFEAMDADFAAAYGEGERTIDWFRREIGGWYAEDAARHGLGFGDDTVLIAEWFRVVVRI